MKKRKTLAGWFKRSGAIKWARRFRFTERDFAPYVKSIGRLLLAWNDLHERLATLFAAANGAGWVERSLAIWHSIRSDYTKRQMLRAALERLPDAEIAGRTKLLGEVKWILDCVDGLEGLRDDAAHTPLHSSTFGPLMRSLSQFAGSQVFADVAFHNPRAMRIISKKRDLLVEHRYAQERILVLRDYVIAVEHAWMNAQIPWPERPDLPERRPSRRSKGRAAPRKKK